MTEVERARVLLIANFAERVGGGEESLLVLARGLDRRRFSPHVLVPGEGAIADELRRAGVAVSVLALPPVRPWTAPASIRALRALRCRVRALGVSLVHAHGSRGALYAGLATLGSRVPLVWHVRITDPDPLLDRVLLSLSTRVVTNSQAVVARFGTTRHTAKVRVVYNGVDPEHWNPAALPALPRASPVVLLAGRLMEEKGQRTLIRAAPAVLARVPHTRFVLMGSDSDGEGARLRALARTLGVQEAVEIRPWALDPRPAFAEADVVVLPSRSEGFGRVLIEAACMRKPTVASRVGGIPEVVLDGETGLLVAPDDPHGLAEAVTALLADPVLCAKLGARARRRALECFTVRQHVEGVQAVYEEALEGARRVSGRASGGAR